MPLEAQIIDQAEETAIREAEQMAPNMEQLDRYDRVGKMEDVIDARGELQAFYKTAHRQIENLATQLNDPRLQEQKQRLDTVYAGVKNVADVFFHDCEEAADQYWQDLLMVLEMDEREAIQHGENALATLGMPADVKLERYRYDKKEKVHVYSVNYQNYFYSIKFHANHEIEIWTSLGSSGYLRFYKTKEGTNPDNVKTLTRKTSLKELRDLSAFHIELIPLDRWGLDRAMSDLISTYRYLPKLSTRPELQEDYQLIEELTDLNTMYQSLKWPPSGERHEPSSDELRPIVEKFHVLFQRRVRRFLDLIKQKPENNDYLRIGRELSGIISKQPHFYKDAIQVASNLEELNYFSVSDLYDSPYRNAHFEEREAELEAQAEENFKNNPNFRRLSKTHKKYFIELQKGNIDFKGKESDFLKAYQHIPENLLDDLNQILKNSLSHFADIDAVLTFVRSARGMDEEKFNAYSEYVSNYKNIFSVEELKNVSTLIKRFKDPEIVVTIYLNNDSIVYTSKEMASAVLRVKRLMKSKNLDWYGNEGIEIKIKKWGYNRAMLLLENLNQNAIKTLMEDYRIANVLIEKLPDTLRPVDIRKLNNLKPFQIEALKYLDKIHYVSGDKFTQFIDNILMVQNQIHLDYILANGTEESAMMLFGILRKGYTSSVDIFSGQLDKTKSMTRLWDAIENTNQAVQQNNKGPIFTNSSYRILDQMIDLGIGENDILFMLPDLQKITSSDQEDTIRILMTKNNSADLLRIMAQYQDKFNKWEWGGDLTTIYFKVIKEKPSLAVIPRLIERLSKLESNKDQTLFDTDLYDLIILKTKDYNETFRALDRLEDPILVGGVLEIKAQLIGNGLGEYDFDKLIRIYFHLNVSPADLKDPSKILKGFESFARAAHDASYLRLPDPDYNRALSLIGKDSFLDKEDITFDHIAFIINILQGSGPEFTKEKITQKALKMLNGNDVIMKEKGARLLIGLGSLTSDFDIKTITKIAKEGVDEAISSHTISDDIAQEHFNYLQQKGLSIPLSLYFSMLIAMEEENEITFANFYQKVDRYQHLAKMPVYQGRVLVLSHNKHDTHHSYLTNGNFFNPDAHLRMANIQGLKTNVLRHEEGGENLESMMSQLELTGGDLTAIIGGHGNRDIISFGKEEFDMKRLFESLSKRLEKQTEGEPWNTFLIFESCHSSENINILMDMWKKDPRTQNHPVRMLSSSSEGEGSAKMAGDSWVIKAKQCQDNGEPLTWEGLYNDIESRNFIMSDKGKMNSNMTLFEYDPATKSVQIIG